jgi:hypothetical protein
MICNDFDMKKWKKDQINYFNGYLRGFEPSTKEYQIISNGIEELKKAKW